MMGTTIDSPELPTAATDSPIWKHLQKRGKVDINDSYSNSVAPLNIYYEVYGSGTERIVFINGMRANHQMWEENVEQFLKLGNYECLVYDHRGTGYSDTSSGAFSITSSTLASDLKRLMDVLKWSKANIVSVSMGGMIALDFAYNNTDMVKTLTLGATSAKINIPPLTSVVDSARVIFSWNSLTKFRNVCMSKYTHEHLLSPAPSDSGCNNMLDYYSSVAKRKAKYRPRMAYSTVLGQLFGVFRHSVSSSQLAILGESLPNKQILVVVGKRDRVIDPANSAYIVECIGPQHVISEVYDDAAHALHSQECVRFVNSIDSMISKFSALDSK